MLGILALVFLGIVGLIAFPVILALAIVFLVLKLVLGLILLPFRLAGLVIGGTIGAMALMATGVLGALIFTVLAIALFGAVILPLLPLLVIAGGGYLLYHLLRPARPARV